MEHLAIHQELKDTRKWLEKLFEEVKAEESPLSGGTRNFGIGGQAIQSLLDTKIAFGNPKDNLIRLTEELFKDIGVELNSIRKQQMKDQYDFYYMTMPVYLQPARGVQLSRLECRTDFSPKGENEAIVQDISPKNQWKDFLSWSIQAKAGAEVNLKPIPTIPDNLPADIRAKTALKVFMATHDLGGTLGKCEVVAVGEGDSECFWRIETPDLQQMQTVKFRIVFKVPKQVASVELSAIALAEADFQWLTANLKDVFRHLKEEIKLKFKGLKQLPVGDGEKWTLTLPK